MCYRLRVANVRRKVHVSCVSWRSVVPYLTGARSNVRRKAHCPLSVVVAAMYAKVVVPYKTDEDTARNGGLYATADSVACYNQPR